MRYFFARLTLLYSALIEQEKNVVDDFTEDVHTFLMSDFSSTFDKSFSGVSTILFNNELCGRVIWQVEVSLF